MHCFSKILTAAVTKIIPSMYLGLDTSPVLGKTIDEYFACRWSVREESTEYTRVDSPDGCG
jgi:hypothetical protein